MILSTNYMLLHSIHCYYTKTRTVSQWLAHLAQGHHGIQCRPQPAAVCRPHRLLLLELAEQRQGLRATRLHVVCQCCPQTENGKDRKQRAVRQAICHLQTLHIRQTHISCDVIARARGNAHSPFWVMSCSFKAALPKPPDLRRRSY